MHHEGHEEHEEKPEKTVQIGDAFHRIQLVLPSQKKTRTARLAEVMSLAFGTK